MRVEQIETIEIPELEEAAAQHRRSSVYPEKVDEILVAYGDRVSWADIARYCNREFNLQKSPDAYRARYQRVSADDDYS